jgi:hypothetical protein
MPHSKPSRKKPGNARVEFGGRVATLRLLPYVDFPSRSFELLLALVMEQTGPTNDPFKGFPFPRDTTPLQRHLYAGAKNICSGTFVHRKAAIQLIWQNAGIVWHPWIDRAGLGKSTPPVHPSVPVTAAAGRQLSLLHCSDALENGRAVERGLQFSTWASP